MVMLNMLDIIVFNIKRNGFVNFCFTLVFWFIILDWTRFVNPINCESNQRNNKQDEKNYNDLNIFHFRVSLALFFLFVDQ